MNCECGEKLRLVVKNEEEVIYTINKDGSLEIEDSRGVYSSFILECVECGSEYKIDGDDYFEMQKIPQLYRWSFVKSRHVGEQIKQNMNELTFTKK